MLELLMVISEEEIINNNTNCISDFNEILTDPSVRPAVSDTISFLHKN